MKTKEKIEHPYYSFDRLLSHNAMFNYAVGGRGIGKTYGAILKALTDALADNGEFIYMRRYKEELSTAVRTFMDPFTANGLFSEWDFRVENKMLQASGIEFQGEKKREWKTLGYFIPLSTAQSQKSTAFPRVRTIIFDEFIIEKGAIHYLPDEATIFMNFYSTVDRWQDKTRVFFLANSVSIMNPYFMSYDISPDPKNEIVRKVKLRNGQYYMACHFIESKSFAESVKTTKFGQFISGTAFEDFAIGNQFADNNDHMLCFKDEDARYLYTVWTTKGKFSVWYNGFSGNYYTQKKLPKDEKIYVLEATMMRENTILLDRSSKLLQYLRASFSKGTLSFDTAQTRNAMIEVFKR